MRNRITYCLILTVAVNWLLVFPAFSQTMDVAWGVQIGTSGEEMFTDVASDRAGNSYVVGRTDGDLVGASQGQKDGFIAKYNSEGGLQWQDQFGTSGTEEVTGVTVDHDLNVYVFGQTNNTIGDQRFGRVDVFIRKYNSQGDVQWTKQYGTSGGDYPSRITVDENSNCYAIGKTTGDWATESEGSYDAFLLKLDSEGKQIWVSQFGSSGSDEGRDVTFNSEGDVFVVGQTNGDLAGVNEGNQDGFFAKLNDQGEVQWIQQFGSSQQDQASGIALDNAGNIYIGGWTGGVLGDRQYGNGDAYLALFDSEGEKLWIRQFGTGNWDGSHGLTGTLDGSGDVVLSGCWTWPSCHGWMRRYNSEGELVWEKLIYNRASSSSCGQTVAIDPSGACYHVGLTEDNLFATSAGGQDGFLVKVSSTSGIRQSGESNVPTSFRLSQNYPNPFNPTTEIQYETDQPSQITINILNMNGQRIRTLADDIHHSGSYSVTWDARNDAGQPVSSGMYFCELRTEKGVQKIKMVLMR